jgi:hypothetical protein
MGYALHLAPSHAHALCFSRTTGAVVHRTEELALAAATIAAAPAAAADGSAAVPFRLTRNLQVRMHRAPSRMHPSQRPHAAVLAHCPRLTLRARARPDCPPRPRFRSRSARSPSRGPTSPPSPPPQRP